MTQECSNTSLNTSLFLHYHLMITIFFSLLSVEFNECNNPMFSKLADCMLFDMQGYCIGHMACSNVLSSRDDMACSNMLCHHAITWRALTGYLIKIWHNLL